MRRGQVLILLALASGLMSVLLAVAVNVATGGTLPGSLAGWAGLAWPAVGVLAVVTVALAFWQQRLQERASVPAGAGEPDPPVPAELPDRSVHFAGRAVELAQLTRAVEGGARLVAIAGTAGVGKSALALHFARVLRESYPGGQLYARLRGASTEPVAPASVLARFLAALGAPEGELHGEEEALAARYRTRLAGRRVLVLLDDAADADQVRPLLPGDPGCLTVVTSRPVLAGLGEAALFDLDVMGEREATELLTALVGAERLAAEPEATAAVLRACGYLPLAVAVAGGRLRARRNWTVAALASRLADERRRLDELSLGNSEVRASFEATRAELSEPDALVFSRLGAHPGAEFSVGAAAALAGAAEDEVRAALERFADVRLVEVVAVDRYWMHDLMRLFAFERLAAEEPAGERAAPFARVLDWYAAEAAAAVSQSAPGAARQPGAGPASGSASKIVDDPWFRVERDNVLAAARGGVEAGEHERVWRLVEAVEPLTGSYGAHSYRAQLWTAALTAAGGLDHVDKAALANYRLGGAYGFDGFHDAAVQHLRAALARWEQLGDRVGEAAACGSLGDTLRAANRLAEAAEQYERSLALCESEGLEAEQAEVLSGLGSLHLSRHEPELAVAALERAVELRRRPDADPAALGWPELLLGTVSQRRRGVRGRGEPTCR